jgi:cell division cycle protein 37
MPIDYSKWKDIEVSDDEDDTHPNIDTPSLFRWRHQARVERMTVAEQEKANLEAQIKQTSDKHAIIKQKLKDNIRVISIF